MAKVGRPSSYSEKVANEICLRIMQGESLRRICQDDHLPSAQTVMTWISQGKPPEFLERYQRAREMQAEYLANQIVEIADDVAAHDDDRKGRAAVAKLQMDGRKWTAERLRPKVYGRRETVTLQEIDMTKLTPEQLQRLIAGEPIEAVLASG